MEHIQLHVGQEMVLTLPGRGTAGYTWTYETAGDTAVLSVTLGAAPPQQSPTPKSGSLPDQPAPFFAICSFTCESVDAFMTSFMPHMAELQGDIPNYTDVEAVIQISEWKTLL